MRPFLPLLAIVALFSGCASTASYRGSINTCNYAASKALVANYTTTGVVLQSTPIHILHQTDNLIVGLPTAIYDSFVGTDFSTDKIPAIEYQVRVENTRFGRYQIITIVQGRDVFIPEGSSVFVITTEEFGDRVGVRLQQYRDPKTYGIDGVKEKWEAGQPLK